MLPALNSRTVDAVQVVRVSLPLVQPWRTAHGVIGARDAILVRAVLGGVEGWGECPSLPEPTYSAEYTDATVEVLDRYLVPRLLEAGVHRGAGVAGALAAVKGHPMAKSGLELAVLDAELRAGGVRLAAHLAARCETPAVPAARVPAGIAIGVTDTVDELLRQVGRRVEEGYRRVKLKIQPGWDREPVSAVRSAFGDDLTLCADANGSYAGLTDPAGRLSALDAAGLAFIEQPLGDDDLVGHGVLATRIATPLCLDESITSAALAEAALSLGACSVVNVKAPRVGGYIEAVRVHDRCKARGAPVWCGGMLETGVGRAANIALASLPDFTIPGDVSGTGWLFEEDVISKALDVDHAGHIAVPSGPGTGVEVRADVVAGAKWTRWYRRRGAG